MIQSPQMQQPIAPATPGASAVNIQIFNPQAYGSAPVQQQNLDSQVYGYPQASVYNQAQAQPQYYAPQQVQVPTPQVMPQAVLNEVPTEAPQAAPVQTEVATQEAAPVQAETVAPEATPTETVDNAAILTALAGTDLNAQTDAITKIAQYAQATPDVALQVVDNNIMQNLVAIINKDTTSLEGPSQQQIDATAKLQSGEQLTAEEQALLEQVSPREIAEKNKVFSLFTLAMLQKLQRDEIAQYNAQNPQAQLPQMQIAELTGYNDIINTINTTQLPAVKTAAIQALSYVATPEDKATLEAVLTPLASDAVPEVQQSATEALAKLGAAPTQQAQA